MGERWRNPLPDRQLDGTTRERSGESIFPNYLINMGTMSLYSKGWWGELLIDGEL